MHCLQWSLWWLKKKTINPNNECTSDCKWWINEWFHDCQTQPDSLIKVTFSWVESLNCVDAKGYEKKKIKLQALFLPHLELCCPGAKEATFLVSSKLAGRSSSLWCPQRTDGDHSSILQMPKCHVAHDSQGWEGDGKGMELLHVKLFRRNKWAHAILF